GGAGIHLEFGSEMPGERELGFGGGEIFRRIIGAVGDGRLARRDHRANAREGTLVVSQAQAGGQIEVLPDVGGGLAKGGVGLILRIGQRQGGDGRQGQRRGRGKQLGRD